MSRNIPLGPLRPPSFRWKAFGIHLAISLALLGLLLYVLLAHWFPGHLFDTDGGWQALQIIIAVDMVLGPALTLVAAAPAKPTRALRTDFTIIAMIQAAALVFGTWTAWNNRPYAMLWLDGGFNSMPYSAFAENAAARERISQLPGQWPKKVIVRLPPDLDLRTQLFKQSIKHGTSVLFSVEYYAPFDINDPDIRNEARAYAGKLLANSAARAELVQAGIIEPDLVGGHLLLIPVYTRNKEYHLAFQDSGQTVTRHDFLPYTAFSKTRQQMSAAKDRKPSP